MTAPRAAARPGRSPRRAGGRRAWVFPARNREVLLTSGRRRAMPPFKTLRALGLGRGMRFLDVGCGPGYFTIPAGRLVGPEGEVFACDISPAMLREVRGKAREEGLENLRLRRCRDPKLPFPDGSADLALLAFVLHETGSVREMLAETRRTLRPGGWAALIEWHRRPTEHGPPIWSRFRPPELRRELRAAGFSAVRGWDHDGDTYFLIARAGERLPASNGVTAMGRSR